MALALSRCITTLATSANDALRGVIYATIADIKLRNLSSLRKASRYFRAISRQLLNIYLGASMAEAMVIFSITALGSLVRWSANIALRRLAMNETRATVGVAAKGDWSNPSAGTVDPVLRVGFTLACYGAIVLVLVSALPGALALERTCFAFALLCAGGVVGEIAGARATAQASPAEDTDEGADPFGRTSRTLSVALALTLNVSIALMTAGQGLIPIVTLSDTRGYVDRLEPVVVVAKRSHDPLEERGGSEAVGL